MEGETHIDVVLTLHQSPWQVRTFNGGRWQVYGPGLLHVADFAPDQKEEAERLCDMHNEALELLKRQSP